VSLMNKSKELLSFRITLHSSVIINN